MASLSDARFQLPDANVAVRQATAGVDNTLASSIKAFGDIGGEAFKGHLEGTLVNDLQDTGNIINTINAGDDAIRDAVKKGNIDPTSKRFQSLAAATSQGKISQQRATIEAEVLLRESIAKAPGFANEFRKTAREVLGFDPSSASLNTLFLSGPDAAKTQPLTQEQKDMQQAEAMFSGGAVESVEQGFKLIQQDRANQLRENIQAGKIADGRVNAGQVAVEGANRVVDRSNQVMLGAFQQIENQGGIADIEAFRGAILSVRDQVKSKTENEMASSQTHIYSPEEYNQVRARIDEQAQAYIEILENQDLTAILAKNSTRLADLVEIAGVQLAPDLAILAPFGETVIRSYMDMMTISGGDPVKLEELMKADPTKAFVGNLVLDGASISTSLRGIADGTVGTMLENGSVDEQTAKAVLLNEANGIAAGKKSDIGMAKIVQGLTDADMPKTAVSLVSKKPRESFTEMGEQERMVTVQNMNRTQDQQVTTLQRALSATDGLTLGFQNGEFVVVDPQGRDLKEIDFTAPSGFASEEIQREFTNRTLARSAGVTDALDYINQNLSPIMNDTRWASLAGFENGNDWAQTLINQVNIGSIAGTIGDEEAPLISQLGLRQQGRLRSAFRAGDIAGAIDILSEVEGAGVGGAAPTSFNTGTDLTGVSQPIVRTQNAGNTSLADTRSFEGDLEKATDIGDGRLTIGRGHNLTDNPLTAEDFEAMGLDPNTPQDETLTLTPEQREILFQRDMQKLIPEVSKIPAFAKVPRPAQKVLIDMGHHMGVAGLKRFNKMLSALDAGRFDEAADELLDSDMARGYQRINGKLVRDEDGNPKVVMPGNITRANFNANVLRSLAEG
jgi:GH24 family phage-related lysozyme (muramidase)